MSKILVTLLFLCNCINGFAQFSYSIFSIPSNLSQDAAMVVRLDEQTIIIKDEGHAVVKHKYAYTILTPGGDEYSTLVVHYDKLRKVDDIDGTLYNAAGFKVRSLKKNEIKDYSNTSESNLADDDRVKVHSFNYRIYPYTIEYETNVEINGLFYIPAWIPVPGEKVSVEKSILRVEAPVDYQLRFKHYNTTEPVISNIKNQRYYQWQLDKFTAIAEESFTPSWYEMTPAVFLAPSNFEMQKFSGSMNNWAEFGSFIYKLNENRDVLPEQVKKTVHQLTDQLPSPKEKINVLYKYLQENTRYISIQFGIGGWQTLDAEFVASNGYGDCKALSNYMFSLLKEAGIKSHYTLVKAGRLQQSILKDFPSNQFNHIIICVPQQKDSIWLECTSQTLPPGYLSSFTANRPVLLIDEKGGTLTQTPAYHTNDNLQLRKIDAVIDADGLLTATVSSIYIAEQQDHLHDILRNYSKEKIAEYVKTKFKLATYETDLFNYRELNEKLPVIKEDITLKAKNYASVSGKRLFVCPNVLSVSEFKIRNADTRKYDIVMKSEFTDYDTVHIKIPDGFTPESVPADVIIEMPLATYTSSVKINNGTILYTRFYRQTGGRLPAKDAKTVADFFDRIYKADHSKIVFVKESSL